jgi:hypothetical protein
MDVTTDGQYIDFGRPIHMTDSQKAKFITLMKELFPEIEIDDKIKEPDREGPEHTKPKHWSKEDYLLLLNNTNNEDVARLTGRSARSVMIQRGQFVPSIISWAGKHGHTSITESAVEEFMKSR